MDWDVLTLDRSMQLCIFPVCTWGVSSDCIYMTPGHILVTKLEQWNGFSSVVKHSYYRYTVSHIGTNFYSKWIGILQNCNIIHLKIFLCKNLQTCESLLKIGNTDYFICAHMCICHFLLTYSITCFSKYILLLKKICNILHIFLFNF